MSQGANQLELYFSGSVAEKLAVARQCFQRHSETLLRDEGIITALERLQECGEALRAQMEAMEMGQLCSACAAREKGGCCSSYMAGNSDAILLLINLLQGQTIEILDKDTDECCFLGPRGCTLQTKPIFCLNYNCSHIREKATPEQMEELEKRAAALLSAQTALETEILQSL